MTLQKKIFVSIFLLLCSFPAGLHAATAFDYSAWDAFLKKNVNENGEVACGIAWKGRRSLGAKCIHCPALGLCWKPLCIGSHSSESMSLV